MCSSLLCSCASEARGLKGMAELSFVHLRKCPGGLRESYVKLYSTKPRKPKSDTDLEYRISCSGSYKLRGSSSDMWRELGMLESLVSMSVFAPRVSGVMSPNVTKASNAVCG